MVLDFIEILKVIFLRKLQVQVGHLLVERGPKISHEDQFQILCKR